MLVGTIEQEVARAHAAVRTAEPHERPPLRLGDVLRRFGRECCRQIAHDRHVVAHRLGGDGVPFRDPAGRADRLTVLADELARRNRPRGQTMPRGDGATTRDLAPVGQPQGDAGPELRLDHRDVVGRVHDDRERCEGGCSRCVICHWLAPWAVPSLARLKPGLHCPFSHRHPRPESWPRHGKVSSQAPRAIRMWSRAIRLPARFGCGAGPSGSRPIRMWSRDFSPGDLRSTIRNSVDVRRVQPARVAELGEPADRLRDPLIGARLWQPRDERTERRVVERRRHRDRRPAEA